MHEAIKWYKKAAKAGNVNAQYNLGSCYLQGTGVAVDKVDAVKWLTLAAKGGLKEAQTLLNIIRF
jgi:TPR repeat protein